VYSNTLGAKVSLFCGSGYQPIWGRVMGISLHIRLRQTVALIGTQVTVYLRRNTVDRYDAGIVVLNTNSYVDVVYRLREDWRTSTARYTAAGASCLGIGFEVTAAPASGQIEVAEAWLEVEYADTPYIYDPYDGATPDAVLGDLQWTKVGAQSSALIGNFLNLADSDNIDTVYFTLADAALDRRHVTDAEVRLTLNTIPVGPKLACTIFGRSDGVRDVALNVVVSGGQTYVGLTGGASGLDNLATYLVSAALPMVAVDRHFRLRIDRDDDAQYRGRVQVFVDYSPTPLLDTFYNLFPTTASSENYFGVGGAAPNSDNTNVDIDYVVWNTVNKHGEGIRSWYSRATSTNDVVHDTTDADIQRPLPAIPMDLPIGQSRACARLDVDDSLATALVEQYAQIRDTGWIPIEDYSYTERPQHASAVAYDSDRGVVVVFGGLYTGGLYQDTTWEYDGTKWYPVPTATMPSMRSLSRMAYDRDRKVMVLFGGLDSAITALNDTWEYDGIDWTQVVTATLPSIRFWHDMAYDRQQKKVLMFGGTDTSFTDNNETWLYDGVDWTQQFPASSPPAREGTTMTYDPVRDRTVLFGGYVAGFDQNDTWEYDGLTWTQIFPAHTPPIREQAGMDFCPDTNTSLLFGGFDYIGPTYYNDLWDWDGVDWVQRMPVQKPPPRTHPQVAYHEVQKRLIVYGGHDGTYRGDTWEYDILFPVDLIYHLTVDYKNSDTNTRVKVALQRLHDFYYWNEGLSSWQAAPTTVTLPDSATRDRIAVMTNITVTAEPEVWRVRITYDSLGAPIGPPNVYIYKAYLKAT